MITGLQQFAIRIDTQCDSLQGREAVMRVERVGYLR